MSDEFDLLAQKKEAELRVFCLRMDELKMKFIDETISFASDWFDKTAKVYIGKYSDLTLAMDEETIRKMRIKIRELVRSSSKIVKGELEGPELWWHQRPRLHDPADQYTQLVDKYPVTLDRAVRHILGHLGIVLEEFKFRLTASGNTGVYQEFWFEHISETDKIAPFYPHLVTWTKEMQDTIREYNVQYLDALSLFNEIQKIKDEKKRQQALARWESE